MFSRCLRANNYCPQLCAKQTQVWTVSKAKDRLLIILLFQKVITAHHKGGFLVIISRCWNSCLLIVMCGQCLYNPACFPIFGHLTPRLGTCRNFCHGVHETPRGLRLVDCAWCTHFGRCFFIYFTKRMGCTKVLDCMMVFERETDNRSERTTKGGLLVVYF